MKWAVGIGTNWKGREAAGKLALAVSIVADMVNPILREELEKDYPGFGALCSGGKIVAPGAESKKKKGGGGWGSEDGPSVPPLQSVTLPMGSVLLQSGLP